VSADKESPDELFARRCVERVLDVPVNRWDRRGREAAVDYHIDYDGRQPAALEITTLTDQAMRQISALSEEPLEVVPRLFDWHVTPHAGTKMTELRRHVPRLIALCEATGVDDPAKLPNQTHLDVEWWETAPVTVKGYRTSRQPRVRLLRPPVGGATKDSMSALVDSLGSIGQSTLITRKIKKLQASQLGERHLFLLVDDSGLGFGPYYALATKHAVPTDDPSVPEAITTLWLASGWTLGGVLRWSRGSGWSRHWPFDNAR
jgi:hypothetical protein